MMYKCMIGRRIVSMGIRAILSIATFFAVISITEKTIYAVDYDLWVGGVRVTDSNLSGGCDGGGRWSYSGDNSSGTLTLTNAIITDVYSWSNTYNICSEIQNLNINLVGDNKLSGAECAIFITGYDNNVTLSGSGTVDASAQYNSIVNGSRGYIMINGPVVKASNTNGPYGMMCLGDITIQNSVVNATSKEVDGISSDGLLSITDSVVSASGERAFQAGSYRFNGVEIFEPEGGYIGTNGVIVNSDGSYATNVVIGIVKNISVSASPSAGGTVEGGKKYLKRTQATVKGTPNDGYSFVNWTENGTVVSTDATYTFTVNDDRSLTANFSKDTYTITFHANNGTDDSTAQTVNKGDTANLKPNGFAYAGHTFTEWTENADGSGKSYKDNESVTVNENMNLYAQWKENEPDTYSVTVTSTEGGSGEADKKNGKEGDTVKLSAKADEGYDFKEWKVEAGGVELSDKEDANATFKIKNADVKVKAVFEKKDEPTPKPKWIHRHHDDDDSEDEPAPEKPSNPPNPNLLSGVFYVNNGSLPGVVFLKVTQGPLGIAAFSGKRPAGFKEAFSFNMIINNKVDYTLKNGVLCLNIPAEYQKAGRVFKLSALDAKGDVHIFDDEDSNPATITCNVGIDGFAFELLYKLF